MSAPLIILAAGGTGGHVFPAEALASELQSRGYRLALLTDRRGQAYGGTLGNLQTFRIRASGVAGTGFKAKLRAVVNLAIGVLQARRILRKMKPVAVVGFGGYASVPTVFAASRLNIPTAIHEQNAVLGRANRLLAPRVDKIATSYKTVRFVTDALRGKVEQTGMPVRPGVMAQRREPYPDPHDAVFNLLVIGGSQGAQVLSRTVPAALCSLPEAIRRRLKIAQQCRPEDLADVRRVYGDCELDVTLDTFFKDAPQRMAESHLVIARSGASTVSELTTMGRPSILVPYPHAIDDHQTANAHAIDEAGGAWLIPQDAFTPEALAGRLKALLELPGSLSRAANCARAAGQPDAAAKLADLVASLHQPPSEKAS